MSSVLDDARMQGFLLTVDSERARAFFEQRVGMTFVSQDQFALVMQVGGHHVRISPVPSFDPRPATVLGWQVSDIEATVRSLQERGVVFEIYPFMQDQALPIWSAPSGDRVAWFKDPDGNVLSVSQHVV